MAMPCSASATSYQSCRAGRPPRSRRPAARLLQAHRTDCQPPHVVLADWTCGRGCGDFIMTKKNKRNSALTIKVILDAAREEFIESGINKATIEKIADRADISQQLIYHYFGGKETLYQEMLADTAR